MSRDDRSEEERFPLGVPTNRPKNNPLAPQDRWRDSSSSPGFLENRLGHLATKPKPLPPAVNLVAVMPPLMPEQRIFELQEILGMIEALMQDATGIR